MPPLLSNHVLLIDFNGRGAKVIRSHVSSGPDVYSVVPVTSRKITRGRKRITFDLVRYVPTKAKR